MPALPRTPARTRSDPGSPRSSLGPPFPRVGCRRRDQPEPRRRGFAMAGDLEPHRELGMEEDTASLVAPNAPSHSLLTLSRARKPVADSVLAHAGTTAASPSPRPRRRRTHRDVHQLPSLRPPRPANQGSPSTLPVLARCPGAVGLVAGEVYPRRRYPCRHLIEHLGSQLLAQVRAAHGWPHAGVATANPLGSAAASHSRPRPHARLHRTKPHRAPQDPMRRPMAGKPPRGPQGSKSHPRSGDPVRLGLIRGGF
jgi:hypothetical protein